jgi:Tol biopolymer transport system component
LWPIVFGAKYWPGDYRRTAFLRRTCEGDQALEEEVQSLTEGQLDSLGPVIAPDGKKLYVVGQQLRGELLRYDSKSEQWVPYLGGISAEFVNYSPNRQWVTYVSFPDGALWRSRIDGSERLQLTAAPMTAMAPCWSPDGNKITFQGGAAGVFDGVYIATADAGRPNRYSWRGTTGCALHGRRMEIRFFIVMHLGWNLFRGRSSRST